MNAVLTRIWIIFLILIFVSSAGCIRHLPIGNTGDTEAQAVPSVLPTTIATSPPGPGSSNQSPGVSPPVVVTTPPYYLNVETVDPGPYVTPDPYRIPYRDHGNWTTGEPDRVPRIPQFTKKVSLRSNSTAFQVNVTKGPLVIDLTYQPEFSNPDNTNLGSTDKGLPSSCNFEDGGSDCSDNSGTSGGDSVSVNSEENTVAMNSFVFSKAEVRVFDKNAGGAPIATEGYGGVYSSDLHKQITIYREGSYIITISGNFIDVNMAIITGSAQVPATPAPVSVSNDWEDD
jgi:hypothetical protein